MSGKVAFGGMIFGLALVFLLLMGLLGGMGNDTGVHYTTSPGSIPNDSVKTVPNPGIVATVPPPAQFVQATFPPPPPTANFHAIVADPDGKCRVNGQEFKIGALLPSGALCR